MNSPSDNRSVHEPPSIISAVPTSGSETSSTSLPEDPTSKLGRLPPTKPKLLVSASTLPARSPLNNGPVVNLNTLFQRSFVVSNEDMGRLKDSTPLRVEPLELASIQDRSEDDTSMETVYVFRVLPESLVTVIKKKAARSSGSDHHVPRSFLRSLSLFEGIKVSWSPHTEVGRTHYSAVRPGQLTSGILTHKKIEGADRLIVPDFKPVLTRRQIQNHYLTLDEEAMQLLRRGRALHVQNLQLARRCSWTDSSDTSYLTFVFRVLPNDALDDLSPRSSSPTGPDGLSDTLDWANSSSRLPINSLLSVPDSKCLPKLLRLQPGQKVEATLHYRKIGDVGRLIARNVLPQEEPKARGAPEAGRPENGESSGDFSSGGASSPDRPSPSPAPKRPHPSTDPGTASPQYNDDWFDVDGVHVHRDQL